MAFTVDHYDNALIISTSFQVVSSGIKNIFSAISTFWHVRGAPQAFKHQQRNPAEHFYTFKHQQHRLYRLLYLQF
jgi:hypothetical protein